MDKTTKQSIEHLCSAWTDDNGIELEANVTDRVLRFQFRKCMAAVMRQWGCVKEEPEVMDVSVVTEKTYRGPQIRYSIVGKAEIAAYCRTNKLAGIEFSQFKHRMGSCDAGQYGFKVKLSKENMERVPPNINVEIHDSLKLFRLKKRYSVPAGDSGFRVDFTIVKSTRAKNLATAQLQQEPEKYEIEVEYIGSDQPSAEAFVDVIERVMCALKDDVHLIAAAEKERVVDFYAALTGKGRAFIGPKPVTLEHQHVGGLSLDYSVTEKADGDRALLVFDATGQGFLLNNRMEVRGTNLVSKLKSTILDVEVVTKINGARLILAFDCYWSNEVPVWNSKTLLERLDLANHAIKNTSTTKSKYELRAKQFYTDGNAATKRILDKIARAEFDYVTDGLVFTPVSAAVGETRAKPSPSLGGTWAAVYKWKEPRDNTIDVLVEESVAQGPASMASFNIFVGSVRATVETYFGGTANNDAFVKYRFVPRGAPETMDVPLDSAGVAKCANGEEIRDKYIVEVGFDLEAKMWRPLRIRHDKIEESKRTGALTANALNPTAASVWRTITNPVTRDQVTGAAPIAAENLVSSAENDDDEYYKGHGTDRTKEIYALREFHNYWVKGVSLLNRFNGRATKLFDVSCGQGGDLNRWVTNGFTTVVGVDKAEGGIVNEKDGLQPAHQAGPTPAALQVRLYPAGFQPRLGAPDPRDQGRIHEKGGAGRVGLGPEPAAVHPAPRGHRGLAHVRSGQLPILAPLLFRKRKDARGPDCQHQLGAGARRPLYRHVFRRRARGRPLGLRGRAQGSRRHLENSQGVDGRLQEEFRPGHRRLRRVDRQVAPRVPGALRPAGQALGQVWHTAHDGLGICRPRVRRRLHRVLPGPLQGHGEQRGREPPRQERAQTRRQRGRAHV